MIVFELISEGPPKAKKAAAKRGAKLGMMAALKYWLVYYRKLHFTTLAFSRYRYKRRTLRYSARKQRKFGHKNPNVWTGKSELRSRFMKPSVSAGKARGLRGEGRFPAIPAYFWKFWHDAPNSGAELVAVNRQEHAVLARVAMKEMAKELRKADRVKTRRRIA